MAPSPLADLMAANIAAATSFLLSFHFLGETFFVDSQAFFFRDYFGEVFWKTVGVVKFENGTSRQLGLLGFLDR